MPFSIRDGQRNVKQRRWWSRPGCEAGGRSIGILVWGDGGGKMRAHIQAVALAQYSMTAVVLLPDFDSFFNQRRHGLLIHHRGPGDIHTF